MTYRLDDETPEEFAARKEDLVVDGAVFLQECGSKVLKLEYPGSASGCRRVTDAIDVPWAVLSAGVDHEAFCEQLRDVDGRRRRRLHRRALAVEGGRRPARRRAAARSSTASPAAAWRSCSRSSTQRDSRAAAARRHRRRHDLLQGARARRRRARSSARPASGRRGRSVPTGAELDPHAIASTALAVAARALADVARRATWRRSGSPAWPRPACCSTGAASRWARRSRGTTPAATDEARAIARRDRPRAGSPRRPACRPRRCARCAKLAVAARARSRRRGRGALARHARVGRALARRRGRRPSCRWRRGRACSRCATARWWPEALAWLGRAGRTSWPSSCPRARRWGASATRCPRHAAPSSPSAGHDHVTAMVGAGATADGDVLHSVGHGRRVRARHPRAARAASGSSTRSPTA